MKRLLTCLLLATAASSFAQDKSPKPQWQGKFEQLGQMLPTPNEYRTGSGAPGPKYWQQQADYDIKVTLDDDKHTITGAETITYKNNSPDVLTYLWLQLDQNILAPGNETDLTKTSSLRDSSSTMTLQQDLDLYGDYVGGIP